MYKVLYNKKISPNSYEMAVEAPLVRKSGIATPAMLQPASAMLESVLRFFISSGEECSAENFWIFGAEIIKSL